MPGARQPNRRLRHERELRGWSLDDVANGLHSLAATLGESEPGVDATAVSRWERGARRPRPYYVRLLCRLFELPADRLGLVEERVGEHVAPQPAAPPVELTAAPDIEDMQRREFIRKLATTFGTVVMPYGLEPLSLQPWEQLSKALRRPPGIDPGAVAELESATAGLHLLVEKIPSRELADRVLRHLSVLSHLLQFSPSADLRRRLAAAAGETAALAGWLAFDLRDHGRARAFYGVALEAAREAGEGPLEACVLGYQSYLVTAEGSHQEAIQVLAEAVRRAGSDYPATRSWLIGRVAEEQAAIGQEVPALDALELACVEFERSQPEEECSWTRFLDRSRFMSLQVATYGRLGRTAEARAAGDRALESLAGEDLKKRAIVLADVAAARADEGELELACELGAQALAIGLRTQCRLGMQHVRDLRQRLEPWRDLPSVRRLEEQLVAAGATRV